VTNIATGVASTPKTNAEGSYVIPFLLTGTYSVRVERAGFKTFERRPIELRVSDRTRVDFALEVGQLAERVTVTAEAELLETSTSNRGQVIESKIISDFPLNSRNPFTLMNLAPGVQYTGSMLYFRPFDQTAIDDFSINGDVVGVLTPHDIFSARIGFNRFKMLNIIVTPADLVELGFPKSFASQLQVPNKYPIFNFNGYMTAGMAELDINPSEIYTGQANMLMVRGTH
jgi:hypothetical protein